MPDMQLIPRTGACFCCLLLLLGDGPELTRNESGTFDIASLHGELQLQLEDGLPLLDRVGRAPLVQLWGDGCHAI